MASTDPNRPLSAELLKLRNGELTVDKYLDHQADGAVAHLSELLDGEQLRALRDVIRSQLETDPVLGERLRRLVDDSKNPGDGP